MVIANPYAEALGDANPAQAIAETPKRLANLVARFSAAQLDQRPAPGKWNVREILAHLADCEIAFGFRLRQAYGGERNVQPFDQDAWARAYGAYSTTQALDTFTAVRAWNIAFIAAFTDDDKRLPAFHPERGAMTLWTIVETMAGHDLHHLAKLEENARRLDAA